MLSISLPLFVSLFQLRTLAAPRAKWNGEYHRHHTGSIIQSPAASTAAASVVINTTTPPFLPTGTAATGTAATGTAPVSSPFSAPVSAPSSTPSSNPSSGGGGGRRGLAYNSSSPSLDIFDGASDIGWGVDWSSSRGQLPSKYMFVPQLWSDADKFTGSWDADVQNAQASNLLSFNEPDIPSQANMPVPSAVSSHITWMNKHASDSVKIGSVSVSNGVSQDPNAPMGLDYLKQWLDQCKQAKPSPCVVDFISVHW